MKQLVIIGGGPAGMSAAVKDAVKNMDFRKLVCILPSLRLEMNISHFII